MFLGCPFKINIYSTFCTHKKRKHHPHTQKDLKASVVAFVDPVQVSDTSDNVRAGCYADVSYGEVETESVTESDDGAVENLPAENSSNIVEIGTYFIFQQKE